MRRHLLADNLKLKAEEMVMRRLRNERRKNTEDFKLEKLNLEERKSCASEEAKEESKSASGKAVTRAKRQHKGSMAKPLDEDDDDDSPMIRKYACAREGLSENLSRLINDKRSTIKEQVEDEEEFTGSSLNLS